MMDIREKIKQCLIDATEEYNTKYHTKFVPPTEELTDEQVCSYIRSTYRQRLHIRATQKSSREMLKEIEKRLKAEGRTLEDLMGDDSVGGVAEQVE